MTGARDDSSAPPETVNLCDALTGEVVDTVTVTPQVRPLPGRAEPCDHCGRLIVWSITLAGPNGPGGKAMPLDRVEHPGGNVAVRPGHGRLLARVLQRDESHDPPVEYLAMPHFATCRDAS